MKNLSPHFLLPTPNGKLETCLELPESQSISGVILVCHPHPLHGGTMNNKVVTTVAKTFREQHYASIRFNYRGVGKSEGVYGEGLGETQDTLNVIRWVKDNLPHEKIILAGFSFGAYVSLKATTESPLNIHHLLTIAPAVNHMEFKGLHPHCPWTVIVAENDAIVPKEEIYTWIKTLHPKPDVLSFPEASHFFDGKLIPLKTELKSILL